MQVDPLLDNFPMYFKRLHSNSSDFHLGPEKVLTLVF
jgi:hypothetical protein